VLLGKLAEQSENTTGLIERWLIWVSALYPYAKGRTGDLLVAEKRWRTAAVETSRVRMLYDGSLTGRGYKQSSSAHNTED